ncbi:hypothetical protein ABMA28_004489 [Loxostege sticticalis]|uniref:Integrase catalytic domain-containing protein n=1 Tax=Loxostege sticticalis TaxID=481309 RepID=A0ABD0SRE1_LOXSC
MLERKLLRNPELKIKYDQVILEYIQLGHMEYVPIEEQHKNDVVYLPHHAVIREDKSTTKLRVVFDASCPGKNGVSLNHDLMIGPALQDDLRHIIMRWRQHPVCLVADIVKMYRQIKVTSEDVDLQRLLWRDNPESETKHLRLLRVTFGTASAPYLAVRTLQQLARDEGVDCPEASEIILNDFYMDDLMKNIHAWTDSSVVLAWLSDHPNKWKTFIANRVSEILTILERKQWSHVSTKNNPADCASRGMKPSELIDFELWRKGPSWLEDKVINYERKSFETKEEKKKPKLCHLVTDVDNNDLLWTKYSTLSHQIRVIAWIKRVFKKSKDTKLPSYLTSKELAEALITCIKHWQAQEFKEDLIKLKNGEQLNKKSKLTCLSPFLDEFGVLRVGGRLSGAAIDENRKHPIIIPAKTHFTNLLIKEAHARTLHGGPQLMVTHLRSRYWILDVKNQVKFFCRKCVICIRHSSRTTEQLMGQLPASRVTPGRPFRQSGVDYAGPINIRTSKGRGHHSYKGYICLFICMATRAIHLELVSDLTSQGFLAAFKRFVARRGYCSDLFSDNGTNFVGANRELKQLLAEEKSQVAVEIADWLANNGTTWHFIPPHAPNFGGLWEAGVKSTKHHLKRVIGVSTLTFEELYTVLSQIEACLNSRPLCQLSTESADPVPFTPGHFLIGEPPVLVPEASYENSSVSSLKRWQFTQRMVQEFWRKWSQEYLSQFLNRYRWSHCVPEPKIGDVVLVKEDDLPPSRWLYGIILQKHPGLDKITRVVSLRCKGVVIERPVSKLCILPVAD